LDRPVTRLVTERVSAVLSVGMDVLIPLDAAAGVVSPFT
jgi:hypothetical protein